MRTVILSGSALGMGNPEKNNTHWLLMMAMTNQHTKDVPPTLKADISSLWKLAMPNRKHDYAAIKPAFQEHRASSNSGDRRLL